MALWMVRGWFLSIFLSVDGDCDGLVVVVVLLLVVGESIVKGVRPMLFVCGCGVDGGVDGSMVFVVLVVLMVVWCL